MVKIRLLRAGTKKRPFYRIVAIDERRRRNGRPLEYLGTYDPVARPERLDLHGERLEAWRVQGAQVTDAVRALARRAARTPSAAPPARPEAS